MERNVTFGRPSSEHEQRDDGVTPSKQGADAVERHGQSADRRS